MRTYPLTIVTPDGTILDSDVICLSVRGAEGDLAVYAGHIPFVTTVKSGSAVVTMPDETEKKWNIASGILNVREEKVTLLTGLLDKQPDSEE